MPEEAHLFLIDHRLTGMHPRGMRSGAAGLDGILSERCGDVSRYVGEQVSFVSRSSRWPIQRQVRCQSKIPSGLLA